MIVDVEAAVAAGSFAVMVALFLISRRALRSRDMLIAQLGFDAESSRRRGEETADTLRALLTASEDAILVVDPSGACRLLNAPASTLFGTVGPRQTLLAVTHSAELDELFKAAERSRFADATVSGEVILRAFGERAMQVLISRIGSDSEARGHIILLRDITDLRRLETVRRDFVANVSHELRTPLTSIKAMAETLLDGAADDPDVAKHFLDTIIQETDRLARLATDLLDLSRIELRPVIKEDNDIATLLDAAVGRLAGQRHKAGIVLSENFDRPLRAPCDADEISQVLLNLIDNAIKYTPRGGAIAISGHHRKGRVVVEVSDTGIGILQQDLPRLFERFYRTDKARSRQSGGTGLGLSIVKHIIERHGGELWVRSEYNRGTTFGFSLPRPPAGESIAARFDALRQDRLVERKGEYVAVGTSSSVEAAASGIRKGPSMPESRPGDFGAGAGEDSTHAQPTV